MGDISVRRLSRKRGLACSACGYSFPSVYAVEVGTADSDLCALCLDDLMEAAGEALGMRRAGVGRLWTAWLWLRRRFR